MDKPAKSAGCASSFLSSPCSAHARGLKTNNGTTAAAERTMMFIVDRTSGSFRTGKRSQKNEPNRFERRPCTHGTAAMAQNEVKIMTSLPVDAMTVTNFYKQNVYDPGDNKIGEISDLLVEPDGKIPAVMVSVGGFLGIGEKDVAVPFNAVRITKKDNKTYLVLNATKDALKSAPGFKYDREKTTWVPDTSSGTVGAGGTRN
jgi:sporulation protein YlmC with PRC-barrel domain